MFTSIPWKRSLFALAVVSCLALTLAKGNLRSSDTSPSAGRALLAGSGVPAPIRSILQRACQDCHSDNTAWPWYAAVPPVSWQVHSDVTRGRAFMNLSKWSEYSDDQRRGFMLAIQAATQARIMPPPKYVWMHGNTKLSDGELKVLQEWALAKIKMSSQNPGVISL
jgi:hypothetical protein